MMEMNPEGGEATALFLHGDFGQPEVVANTGCTTAEWTRWLQDDVQWIKYDQDKPPVNANDEALSRVSEIVAGMQRGSNG